MFPEISSNHKPYFSLSAGLPADYNGLLLPGATVQTAKAEEGIMILQEFNQGVFNIQLSSYYFLQKIKLNFCSNNVFLNTPLALNNSFKFQNREIKNLELKQDQFVLLNLAGKTCEAVFEKEKDYQLFNISFPEEIITELSSIFPAQFEAYSKKLREGRSFTLTRPAWVPQELKYITQKILRAPYQEGLRRYFFDQKIREYLFLLFVHASAAEIERDIISNENRGKLIKIENLLRTRFREYFPVPSLAKSVQMNENKLQTLFRKLYGKGVFEYRRNARLQEARRLILEEKLQIKEVYSLTGYKGISAFITEFKKYFGYSPGSLKKKS
jgi:AraC family transcriptional regulator, transcriptional activator of the genes for pyochelin and ferripyochelin receptors